MAQPVRWLNVTGIEGHVPLTAEPEETYGAGGQPPHSAWEVTVERNFCFELVLAFVTWMEKSFSSSTYFSSEWDRFGMEVGVTWAGKMVTKRKTCTKTWIFPSQIGRCILFGQVLWTGRMWVEPCNLSLRCVGCQLSGCLYNEVLKKSATVGIRAWFLCNL